MTFSGENPRRTAPIFPFSCSAFTRVPHVQPFSKGSHRYGHTTDYHEGQQIKIDDTYEAAKAWALALARPTIA